MNAKKKLVFLLLGLSLSDIALSAGKVVLPQSPTPTPITTTPNVQTGLTPSLITFQPTGGSTFPLFLINNRRIVSPRFQALATLKNQLSPYGLKPCLVVADINATPIGCGNGLVQFGANELYTYGRAINLQKVPVALARGVSQPFAANFRSPVGLIPGDTVGRVVHVHFNEPVAQFAMNFDSGQLLTPSIDSVKFVLGSGTNAVQLTQPLVPGKAQWAGVQVLEGITDLAIVPVGGATHAFTADQISVVTKAKFLP